MSIVIREALPKDDAAIGELLVLAFESTYARKMPEVVVDDERKGSLRAVAAKRAQAHVLVAEDARGAVVGTVSIFRPGTPASEAWLPNSVDLRHLAVDPNHHGKGVSKPLLDEAERIAFQEWKAAAICLHVRRGAHGVARLYAKRGYVREPHGDLPKPTVYLEGYLLKRPML